MKSPISNLKCCLALLTLSAFQLFSVSLHAQVTPGSYVPLCSTQPLTNGSATTITNSASVSATSESIQLMAIVAPPCSTSPTNGNYCTNLVLTFNYVIGTNTTTDTPFTWTIATDQFGVLSQTPHTTSTVVWTNLTNKRGLTGLQLNTATSASTNAYGCKLTVLAGRSP